MRPDPQIRLIAAERVIGAARDLTPGYVEIASGRIVRVSPGRPRRPDLRVAGTLAPGLIDLQINGAARVDFLTGDQADFERAFHYLLSTGVTGFLPTLISAPRRQVEAALDRWDSSRRDGNSRNARRGDTFRGDARRGDARLGDAPRVLGVHLEGPFLNPEYAGAHERRYLRPPDPPALRRLFGGHPRLIKIVTLAPELRGARRLIQVARDHGAVVAAGHTAATYDEARAAFDAGLRLATHLFNAMRPLRHRDPGIVAAALEDPRVTVSLIADLVHVDPAVLRLVFALKPPNRIALVTDAVAVAGSLGRISQLAARRLRVTDAPRLPDGTLAGSVLRMDHAVRNVVELGVPLRDAVHMASAVPAGLLGRRDIGRIAEGARADLVLLDRELEVHTVLVDGRVVSRSDRGRG